MSLDPQKMMKMAAQMQADMARAQAALAEERVEASSGGGMVKAIASGNGDLVGIEIAPEAVDPEEVELLQDMVLAAVTEAFRQAAALQQERMGAITGGLGGLGLPGFQLLSPAVDALVAQLARLPGVGQRTAQRLAFHLLRVPPEEALALAEAIRVVKERVGFCSECFNLSEEPLCRFCSDPRRDRSLICVVEAPSDIVPIERTAEYRGLYHVLGGALSPIDGVDPEHLRIAELLARVARAGDELHEVVLATNPTMTGEATAQYVAERLRGSVKITRLASGLPVGGDLEYADEVTLGRAFAGRREA